MFEMLTKSTALLIITFACLLDPSRTIAAPPQDLASADWSVSSPHSLASNRPSSAAIMSFLQYLSEIRYPQIPFPIVPICTAEFADLRGSGTLSLVVAENDGRFCHLHVVDKVPQGYERYSFDLAHGADGPEIKDLGGNGKLELIVLTDVTPYEGARYCMVQWPVVYAWNGSTYADVSSQYKGFYEQTLASLKKQIAAAEGENEQAQEASPAMGGNGGQPVSGSSNGTDALPPNAVVQAQSPPTNTSGQSPENRLEPSGPRYSIIPPSAEPEYTAPDSSGLSCIKAEAAKIARFVGSSPDAGMAEAISLKNSGDPEDRGFAAWVLADIGTPEAVTDIHELLQDSDPHVKADAQFALEQVSKGPEKNVVEERFFPLPSTTK